MSRTLLVLAASLYQLDAIHRARELGLRVVTTDCVPENPGHQLADAAHGVSTTDRAGVLEIARREAIDGILAPATDVALPTLAYVAARLGLPAPSERCTRIACDKVEFRDFLAARGLPVPRSTPVAGAGDLDSTLLAAGPALLKPDRSSGSKGIFIVRSRQEARERLAETLGFALGGRAVLEEFIDGHQGTVEGVMQDGEPAAAFFLDRQVHRPPYVTTTGHRIPSRLPRPLREAVLAQLREVWGALGYTDGPFDCDFVATGQAVYLLELAPRVGGNSIAPLLRRAGSFDILEIAIRLAVGERPDVPRCGAPRPTAVVLLGVETAGALRYDRRAVDALRAEPWVEALVLDLEPGSPVAPFVNSRHRVGEALVTAEDREALDARVAELDSRLAIRSVTDCERDT